MMEVAGCENKREVNWSLLLNCVVIKRVAKELKIC